MGADTCRCGHNNVRHAVPGFDGECTADSCKCTRFRLREETVADPTPAPLPVPVPLPVQSVRAPVEPGGATVDQLVSAGKRSAQKRTVALAGKLETIAIDLRARLLDERHAAEERCAVEQANAAAKARIAELEAQLAAERAKLTGRTPPKAKSGPIAAAVAKHECRRGCGRAFTSPQGRAAHERLAHDGFDPHAVHAAKAG